MRLLPIIFFLLSVTTWAQEPNNPNKLPSCPIGQNQQYHKCWGTHTWTSGDFSGDTYIGEYKDGKMHGRGTYSARSGEKYVGEFRDGKAHGRGTYVWADGGKHIGEFKDGRFEGQGIRTLVDGRRLEGIWENNNFVREAKVNLPIPNSKPTESSSPSTDLIREASARVNLYIAEAHRLTQDTKYREACNMLDTTIKMITEYQIYNIEIERIRNLKDHTCLLSEQKRERQQKELKEQSNSSSGSVNPLFMDQLIRGGGSKCFDVRQRCRQSNDYHQCMHYFNLNNPGEPSIFGPGPACAP